MMTAFMGRATSTSLPKAVWLINSINIYLVPTCTVPNDSNIENKVLIPINLDSSENYGMNYIEL